MFARLGLADLRMKKRAIGIRPRIHRFLRDHLGPERAHFERCFDLPFLAIADDGQLQRQFLECDLPADEED